MVHLNIAGSNFNLAVHLFLEKKTKIDVRGVLREVEFRLGELPNDMKMLHYLAGKLTAYVLYH